MFDHLQKTKTGHEANQKRLEYLKTLKDPKAALKIALYQKKRK